MDEYKYIYIYIFITDSVFPPLTSYLSGVAFALENKDGIWPLSFPRWVPERLLLSVISSRF